MKNKWLFFSVLFFSALCVSLSQLKIVTILGDLASLMNRTIPQVSWLMSIFTLASIILAIPGGALLAKIKPKKLLLMLMAFLVAGNLMGAFSTTSYTMLLISRTLEGVSFSMIIMVGIVMISQWFAGGNVGLAIGIYTTFPAVASVIAMNVSVPIAHSMGLNSIWIIMTAMSAVAFILVLVVIKGMKSENKGDADLHVEQPSLKEALVNIRVWILAVCHGCIAFVLFTFITIYPLVFKDFYGLEAGTANFYAGLNGLFGIPFCILSGYIIDRFKKVPLLVMTSFVCLGIVCFLTTRLIQSVYIWHTLATALFAGMIIPANLAIAPSVAKKPVLIGYTVAIVNMIYYVGIFFGAPMVLGAVEQTGWNSGTIILTVVSIIGFLFMTIFMLLNPKKTKKLYEKQ